jgi:hypothetical protein
MNPASGTATVAVTTNNSTIIEASSATYTGVASVASGGTSASNNGQTGSNTASLAVTSPAGSLVYANAATARSAAYPGFITALNTPLSNMEDNAAGSFHIDGATSQSTATNPTMSWTWSVLSSPWAISSAVLTPSSAGSLVVVKKGNIISTN